LSIAFTLTISELVNLLKEVDDVVFAEYLFRRDPLYRKVPAATRPALIAGALQCGVDTASSCLQQSGGAPSQTVIKLLSQLGVDVIEEPALELPDYIELATYTAGGSGGTIRISPMMMERLYAVSDQLGMAPDQIRNVVLAHELFHHLETHTPGIFTQQPQVPTWRLFGYQNYAPARSLSEIAATVFAKHLTQAPYSPNIIEIAAAYLTNPKLGCELLNEVLQLHTRFCALATPAAEWRF